MNAPIEKIAQALREEIGPLDAEAGRLNAELTVVKERRDRIDAALTALEGGSPKAKPQRAVKSGPTKRQVTHVVEELLRDNGPTAADDLRDLAQQRLASDGSRSLRGFELRFQEALASPEVRRTADGLVTLGDGTDVGRNTVSRE